MSYTTKQDLETRLEELGDLTRTNFEKLCRLDMSALDNVEVGVSHEDLTVIVAFIKSTHPGSDLPMNVQLATYRMSVSGAESILTTAGVEV